MAGILSSEYLLMTEQALKKLEKVIQRDLPDHFPSLTCSKAYALDNRDLVIINVFLMAWYSLMIFHFTYGKNRSLY